MQQALFQQATFTQIQAQVARVSPGHGTGVQNQAINDENYHDESSTVRLVFSVLGNVIGGTLLLSGMFVLPHVIATIFS